VSEQIRKLEQACGLPLLLRGKTGASLTPAGERLVGHARHLLALSDAAFRDIQGAKLAGDLRLAITDYFRPRVLPGILKHVRDQFPRLHLHVSVRKSAAIEEEADSGDFDIGLSMTVLDKDRVSDRRSDRRIRLRREPLSWIADKSFIMPDGDILPLVVMPDTCSLQRFIIKTLAKNGIPYAVAHSASGIGGLHLALTAGLGVTCLNASAAPEGAIPFVGGRGARLPTLPEVEFSLVPPRPGEQPVVAEVREMLAAQLG
jgi:DNA-binding transcriptional LysR family regulator